MYCAAVSDPMNKECRRICGPPVYKEYGLRNHRSKFSSFNLVCVLANELPNCEENFEENEKTGGAT